MNAKPAAAAMYHLTGDFNLSTVLRNANFFGFQRVYYIGGKKSWDRRGSVGTHHYTPLEFCKDEGEFFDKIHDKYVPIAVECNVDVPLVSLDDFGWPRSPVILFGEEQNGIPINVLNRCHSVITIPGRGSVRSINVGTTSGIVMNAFVNYKRH